MSFNLLIIDESATARAIIRKILGLSGIQTGGIYEAKNGEEALKTLKEQWVDLVLCDVKISVTEGVSLASLMKSDPILKSIPFVMVGAAENGGINNEVLPAGVKIVLRKPFSPGTLKNAIETALDRGAGYE